MIHEHLGLMRWYAHLTCNEGDFGSNPTVSTQYKYRRVITMNKRSHFGESKKYKGLIPGTPDYQKAVYMLNVYGVTVDDYNKMFEDQEGKCAICKKHQIELPKKLHVDHCHKTKKVRGLLCFKCNTAIGHFEDNPEILKNAVEYLENSK